MEDEYFMQRCIELAKKGSGKVAPNPMVGCVIVHNSKIIGEGYHAEFGSCHAEVNAINSVKDKNLLSKSILYVTLEPCSHYGKTPPCSELIIKHKIPEVIIGNKDPFKKVNGSGIKILKENSIKVATGVLEKECRFMNRRFLIFHKEKRPYIILKWAQSSDGFIAPINKNSTSKIHWISNEYSRMLVHKWRSEESAVMVGTLTAKHDNPELTVRNWTGKNPLRIVIDKELKLPRTFHLFDQKIKTIVFTEKANDSSANLQFVKINFQSDIIPKITCYLYENGIQSVIVEGGTHLLQSFMEKGFWDEARVITGNAALISGLKAPQIKGRVFVTQNINDDILNIFLK